LSKGYPGKNAVRSTTPQGNLCEKVKKGEMKTLGVDAAQERRTEHLF
jgi:hypothetical protein